MKKIKKDGDDKVQLSYDGRFATFGLRGTFVDWMAQVKAFGEKFQ